MGAIKSEVSVMTSTWQLDKSQESGRRSRQERKTGTASIYIPEDDVMYNVTQKYAEYKKEQ